MKPSGISHDSIMDDNCEPENVSTPIEVLSVSMEGLVGICIL